MVDMDVDRILLSLSDEDYYRVADGLCRNRYMPIFMTYLNRCDAEHCILECHAKEPVTAYEVRTILGLRNV